MKVLLALREFRVVAFVSAVAMGSAAGTHRSQDFYQVFHNAEARTIFSKLRRSLSSDDQHYAVPLTRTIIREAKKRDIDPLFLLAVIEQESNFRTRMVGSVGEMGLMQVRPETARWAARRFGIPFRGAKTLMNPITNVQVGAAYLGYLKHRYGSARHLYVPAYNMGIRGLHLALVKGERPVIYLHGVESKYHRIKGESRSPASRPIQSGS